MRLFHTATGLMLSLLAINAYANVESQYITNCATAINYVDENPNAIWPDFNFSAMPSVIKFENDHIYAFDLTPKNSHWSKMNFANRVVYFMPKDNIGLGDVRGENYINVDGQLSYVSPSFIASDDPSTFDYNQATSFFVDLRFLPTFAQSLKQKTFTSTVYDNFQTENVQLMYLEIEALKTYLQTNDTEALKDALAIKQYRARSLDQGSLTYENMTETFFGTLVYAGDQALNLDTTSRNQFVLDSFNNEEDCNVEAQIPGEYPFINCLTSTYPELAGQVMDFALDSNGITGWKIALQNGTTPRNTLLAQYPMSDSDIDQRVQNAKIRYNFASFADTVANTINDYSNTLAQTQSDYQASPGIEIEVDFIHASNSSTEVSYETKVPVDSNTNYYTNTNYGEITFSNPKVLHFSFNELPYLILSEQNETFTTGIPFSSTSDQIAIFKLDPNTTITFDNKQTTLAKLLPNSALVKFKNLHLYTDAVDLQINKANGTLISTNNIIKLQVTMPSTAHNAIAVSPKMLMKALHLKQKK